MNERTYCGFGLIELLVALVVVSILASIALPVYLRQRDKAKERCAEGEHASGRGEAGHPLARRTSARDLQGQRQPQRERTDQRAKYVSNALEVGLENGIQGNNVDNIVNPYSGKKRSSTPRAEHERDALAGSSVHHQNSVYLPVGDQHDQHVAGRHDHRLLEHVQRDHRGLSDGVAPANAPAGLLVSPTK